MPHTYLPISSSSLLISNAWTSQTEARIMGISFAFRIAAWRAEVERTTRISAWSLRDPSTRLFRVDDMSFLHNLSLPQNRGTLQGPFLEVHQRFPAGLLIQRTHQQKGHNDQKMLGACHTPTIPRSTKEAESKNEKTSRHENYKPAYIFMERETQGLSVGRGFPHAPGWETARENLSDRLDLSRRRFAAD